MTKSKKLSLLSVIGVVVFLTYWGGVSAPEKEVILKRQLMEDIYTKQVLTSYDIYYKWDGKEEEEPHWTILKTTRTGGVWKVIQYEDLRGVNNTEEILKYAVNFDSKWVNEYKFSPQSTRYQMILLLLTGQPLYSEEKKIFYEILNEIGQPQ